MTRWDKATPESIPDWFWQCIDTPAKDASVEVEDCDVCYRCWGDPGKPALLFIHGMYAHSRWWDFIAPKFLSDYYVVALDLTGMGDSDYRYNYSGACYTKEIVAVADAAALSDNTLLVAHSFGGMLAVKAVNEHPRRFAGLVLVDSGIRHPDDPPPELPPLNAQAAIYPSREAGEARFRLQPPQDCANEYLLKYIAKQSLHPQDGGWSWKFDEDLPGSLTGVERKPEDYAGLGQIEGFKLALIYGRQSLLFSANTLSYMRELVGREFSATGIDQAQHHVFLDQPLEFTAALKEILATF